MGSCFSEEIGTLLRENKFDCLSNPFGTIYNPHSIFKLLAKKVSANNITESQGVFYHWDAHGVISGLTEEAVKSSFEEKQRELQSFLEEADWLIITLGTSFVYEHENVGIVANCHKIPDKNFTKRLLPQKEIIDQFCEFHYYLAGFNKNLNIALTVSPVRHIRDGLVENNYSKAILLDAVHSLTAQLDNVSYFPSYEIVIDELRDYRFYRSDLIHPSDDAIKYIWQRFGTTYFDSETLKIVAEWEKLKTSINHKPFQPQSEAHQSFLKNTLNKLIKMNEKINVRVEIEQIRNHIKKG